jgi:putative ATP-binding cassette transporter
LFLDEATSALDEPTETKLYNLLRGRLPQTTIVSTGHRATLTEFHDRQLQIRQHHGVGRLMEVPTPVRSPAS